MRALRRYVVVGLVIFVAFFLGTLAGDIPISHSKEDMKFVAERVGFTAQSFILQEAIRFTTRLKET